MDHLKDVIADSRLCVIQLRKLRMSLECNRHAHTQSKHRKDTVPRLMQA